MQSFERLLLENRAWAEGQAIKQPDFFRRMQGRQRPEFLWIGCSDSRVPSEIIFNAQPGEMFVHRNIANQIITTDFNSLSVLQYGVDVLEVNHIIVCGHHDCGGVRAALQRQPPNWPILNKWLKHIKDVYRFHQGEIEALPTEEARVRRLVELNVIEQVYNLAHTSLIQQAWKKFQRPALHGWVYGLEDGVIKQLINLPPNSQISSIYEFADEISR